MANITLLPSAKVPLIYPDTDTMTTEWYRFFWNVYGFTAAGTIPVDKGGTGLTSIGEHEVIIGTANNTFEPAVFTGSGIAITYAPGVINLAIGNSGVTPGTYGSASQVGVFTVNQYGSITNAVSTSIAINANQITSGTLSVVRGGTGQSSYTDGQLLIGNSTGNTLTKANLTAGTGISVTNGAGAITLANTGVLSVSGTAPVVSSGGATPAISMPKATSLVDGYLSATDWTTFNSKAPATSGTSILYGNGAGGFSNVTIGTGISFAGGTLSATGSGGTVTSVTGTAPISVATGTTTPVISISQATTSTNGYLSSTDWNTFNNKQPAGSYLTAVSVASANGFAGTSSGGTTPALTLSTTITGLLIGNGTAISAATIGTGLSLVGSTLSNTAPDQTVVLTAGTGISISGTYPSFTVTNTAPDQIVSLTGAGTTSITGTYPNFTITSNDAYVGTVTSVSGTGTVNGLTLTGTVTSSGSLTLGGTLNLSSPPTIGNTTPNTGKFTSLEATTQLTLSNASNWNLYSSGAGANYIAGKLAVGTTTLTSGYIELSPTQSTNAQHIHIGGTNTTTGTPQALRIDTTLTGSSTSTSAYGILNTPVFNVASGASIGTYYGLDNQPSWSGTATPSGSINLQRNFLNLGASSTGTLPNLYVFNSAGIVANASSTAVITNAYGFYSNNLTTSSSVTIANAYAFYGAQTSTGAGTANWNLYMAGSAPNYLAGALQVMGGTATPAGGSTTAYMSLGSARVGIYFGSGAPTISAAQGSIYMRTDGSSTSTRMYINTNGSTTWTNVTTAA